MRIIAGERRGFKLEGPALRQTRPTSDLVRESIFNIVGDRLADREVIDLFAGTGALGLEALSRGARHALFVERDRGNLEVIRRNVAHLRYEERASLLRAEAYRWMHQFVPLEPAPMAVFLDPPYPDYQSGGRKLRVGLASLVAILPAGSLVVVEGPERELPEFLPEGAEWDVRRYGNTLIAIGETGGVEGDAGADGAPAPEVE